LEFDVVGLDLDGTLYPVGSEINNIIREEMCRRLSEVIGVTAEYTRKLFETHYAQIGSGSKTIATIAENHGHKIDAVELAQRSLEEADILEFINPNPELREMLERLRGRYQIDLVTGSGRVLTSQKLERLGIPKDIFGHVLCKEDGNKLDGSIYQRWLGLRSVSPERVLYVGDGIKRDIRPCRDLGIKTCYVKGESDESDYWVNRILELEGLLL